MKANLLLPTILSALSAGALVAASAVAPLALAQTPLADVATPLTEAATLQTIACKPGVVVLDIRSEKIDAQSSEDYAHGHIPCAIHSDYVKAGWRTKLDGVPGMLPSVQKLETLIGGLGIDNNTLVVIAPGGANSKSMAAAARVYWTFKVLGHDRVSILDGGTAGYIADASRALEKGKQVPQPKAFTAQLRPEMLVSEEDVARAAQSGEVLVDYRRQDEFSGLNRNAKTTRAGTLASAHNVPLEWLTQDNGGFLRSRQGLEQIYALAEVPADKEQIAFCNTGHNSSLGWFAAHEILGNTSVRIYDGSMAHWSRHEALPVVRQVMITE